MKRAHLEKQAEADAAANAHKNLDQKYHKEQEEWKAYLNFTVDGIKHSLETAEPPMKRGALYKRGEWGKWTRRRCWRRCCCPRRWGWAASRSPSPPRFPWA